MKNEKALRQWLKNLGLDGAEIAWEIACFNGLLNDFLRGKKVEFGDSAPHYIAFGEVLKNANGCYGDYDWGGINEIAWTPDNRICVWVGY